jgi:hypothetical protein
MAIKRTFCRLLVSFCEGYFITLTLALFSFTPTQWEQVSTMTAPVRSHDGGVLESVRNAVIEFRLVRICLGIGLRDTLGDNLGVALLMARVSAIRALHACGIFEKVSTQSTTHDVVELLLDKLVPILLVDIFLSLANGAFTTKAKVEGLLVLTMLHKGQCQMYASNRLQ